MRTLCQGSIQLLVELGVVSFYVYRLEHQKCDDYNDKMSHISYVFRFRCKNNKKH